MAEIYGNAGLILGSQATLVSQPVGSVGLILGSRASLLSGPVISGNDGLILGSQVNLVSQVLQPVVIPGAVGLVLGIKPDLELVLLATVVIPGNVGLKLGSSGLARVAGQVITVSPDTAPAGINVEIPGSVGLNLGSLAGLVSNPLVTVEIPGWVGLLLAAAPLTENGADYETWVLNDNAFAPAAYTNWPFNSYAQYRGQYYAAGDAGLFLLGGPDQDGAKIHDGVRFDKVNFGTNRPKRLRAMRLGVTGDEATVRLATDKGNEGFYPVKGDQVPISSDVEGRNWTVDIVDFDELSFMEIIALILCGR